MSAAPKTRHARHRLERRIRRAERPEGARLPIPSLEVADPLAQPPRKFPAARLVIVAGAALVAHVVVLAAISAAGTIAARFQFEKPETEKIEVAIVEPPPPPPPAAPEPPPPEPEPPPPPKPKKAPVVKEIVPSKDPIDTPPEPPPPEPPKEEPKRVVGLDAESTVEGGEGPAFAAGNTRMGETDSKAVDPNSLAKLRGPAEPPRAGQRATSDKPTVLPKRKKNIAPAYPERYREQGIEGDVIVRVTVDPAGKPKEVVVVKPSDYEFFNDAAKKAALREEYSPAMKNGIPVEYSVSFKYLFRLDT